MTALNWPDTTGQAPPPDNTHGAALWMIGRHRMLADLLERLPGVVGDEPDGSSWFDADELAGAFQLYDAHIIRNREHPGGAVDEVALDQAAESGQQFARAARALLLMSGTERGRLRLLAMLNGPGTRFAAWMVRGFDERGQELLADWCRAVQA